VLKPLMVKEKRNISCSFSVRTPLEPQKYRGFRH
jgi:hypothetical protein